MNKIMNKQIMGFYLLFSVFSSMFLYMLPLYYVDKGFTEVQIGVLNSVFIFAALTQPVFGYIADRQYGTKKVLYFNLIILILTSTILYFAHAYALILVLVFLFATFQSPMYSLSDIYVTSYTEKYSLNYGHFKKYASLGWGTGVFFALPFMYIFGESGFVIAGIVIMITAFLILMPTEEVHGIVESESHFFHDFKLLMKNKDFVLLLAISCLFWGVARIRVNYQTLLMTELTTNSIYIGVMTFVMIIPEVLFLPYYETIRQKFSFAKIMYIGLAFNAVLLLTFTFCQNPALIAFSTCLHGFMAVIYFPTMIFAIRKVVPKNILVTAMLVNGSALAIFSGLFSFMIVTPLYAAIGIQSIFFALFIGTLFSIPFIHKLRDLKV